MVSKVIPVLELKRRSLPTDSSLRFPSTPILHFAPPQKLSINSKTRPRPQESATDAQRRRKATLFAAVAARRLKSRPQSINAEVGEEYMRRLRALFHASDSDEDNAVTLSELLVFLELMGGTPAEARTFGVSASGEVSRSNQVVTFDAFLEACRPLILRCAQERRPLPPCSFVAKCKPLKNAFQRCDTDENHEISRNELEIALQKLGLVFSDEELDAIEARLDPNGDGRIEWSDFLYAAWQDLLEHKTSNISALHDYFSVDLFTELPSFIHASPDRPRRQTMHQRVRARRGGVSLESPSKCDLPDGVPKSYLSRMERVGVEFLTRVSKERLKRAKRATLAVSLSERFGNRARVSNLQPVQHQDGPVLPQPLTRGLLGPQNRLFRQDPKVPVPSQRYGFSPATMRQILRIELVGALLGGLIGILSGLFSIGLETYLPSSSGMEDAVGINEWTLLVNIGVSVVEVMALYMTAVAFAFQLTVSAGLTLYPLDQEREFLARAVARAALQVEHRRDTLFGMDPMRGSPKFVLLMTYLVYKSKRYVLKFLLKLFIKRILWRAAARSALSAIVLPLQGLLNAWTLRRVLQNCRINILGPPCAIAALETFLIEDACFLPPQRVEYMRVLGCCLVCKRIVHPNVEIMVEHLRHRWMNSESWPSTDEGCICLLETDNPCPAHVLDDMSQFLESLRRIGATTSAAIRPSCTATESPKLLLAPYHLRNIFFLFIVSLVIDGALDWNDRRFYVRVCHAAGVQNHWSGVLKLKSAFVSGRGLDIDAIFSLVQFEEDADHQGARDSTAVPWRESLLYVGDRTSKLLSC